MECIGEDLDAKCSYTFSEVKSLNYECCFKVKYPELELSNHLPSRTQKKNYC